jgi:hypothetical protein
VNRGWNPDSQVILNPNQFLKANVTRNANSSCQENGPLDAPLTSSKFLAFENLTFLFAA